MTLNSIEVSQREEGDIGNDKETKVPKLNKKWINVVLGLASLSLVVFSTVAVGSIVQKSFKDPSSSEMKRNKVGQGELENLVGMSEKQAFPGKVMTEEDLLNALEDREKEQESKSLESDQQPSSDETTPRNKARNTVNMKLLDSMLDKAHLTGVKNKTLDSGFVYAYNKRILENRYRNYSVDPCDDFYKYACGSTSKRRKSGVYHTNKVYEYFKKKAFKKSSFSEHLELNISGEALLQRVYLECIKAKKTSNNESVNMTLELFKDIGGWSMQEGWSLENWDIKKTFKKSYTEGTIPFLKSKVRKITTNDTTSGEKTMYHIVIEYDGGGLYISIKDRYKFDLGSNILSALGVNTNYSNADKSDFIIGNDIYDEYKKIKTFEDFDPMESNFTSLSDLETIVPNIDWVDYIFTRIPDLVDIDQVELSISPADIASLNIITRKTKQLNDYLVHLELSKYKHILNAESIREYVYSAQDDACANWIIQKFPVVYSKIVKSLIIEDRNHTFHTEKFYLVKELAKKIVNKTILKIEKSDWLNKKWKKKIIKKIRKIKFYDTFHDVDEIFASEKETMKNMEEYNGSLSLYENLKKFHQIYEQNIYRITSQEKEFSIKNIFRNNINKIAEIYFKKHRIILLNQFFLVYPNFDEKINFKYLEYSIISEVIAHQIGHKLSETNLGKIGDQENLNFYVLIKAQYQNRLACFLRLFKKTIGPTEFKLPKFNEDENLSDLFATNIAFEVYRDMEDEEPSPEFVGHDLNNDKHFFLSYSQRLCEGLYTTINTHRNRSPLNIRINTVFSQNKHFHETFKCPVGSNMRPRKQCKPIW